MNKWQRKGELTPFVLALAGGKEEGIFTLPKPGIQVFTQGDMSAKIQRGTSWGPTGSTRCTARLIGLATLSGCAARWLRIGDCGTAREPTAGNIYHIHDISNTRLEETRGPNTRCPSTGHSPSVSESGGGFLFLPRGNEPLPQP